MITTTKTDSPIQLSESFDDGGCGMYQMYLDSIREDAEIFQIFAKHDIAEMACTDEAAVIALNEVSIEELKRKFTKMINDFVEKFKMAISKFITKITAKLNIWKSVAKKYSKLSEKDGWGSSKSSEVTYIDSDKFKSRVDQANVLNLISVVFNNGGNFFYRMGIDSSGNSDNVNFKGVGEILFKDLTKTESLQSTKQNIEKLSAILLKISGSISSIEKNRKQAENFKKSSQKLITKVTHYELSNSEGLKETVETVDNTSKAIMMYNQYMIGLMSSLAKGGNATAKAIQTLYMNGNASS